MDNSGHFLTACHTDVGTTKDTNQDSMLLLQAETEKGPILFAVLCDGMGGLAKGEVASGSAIHAFREWFYRELPNLLFKENFPTELSESWNEVIQQLNRVIGNYGTEKRISLGTTVTAFLIVGDQYYITNVGDGRVYLLDDQLYQLTHDQTLVQKEMDAGRMTFDEAIQIKYLLMYPLVKRV